MWSLRGGGGGTFLVLSFISETRVLAMDEEDELGEVDVDGFDGLSPTVYCASLPAGMAQVCPSSLRLVDATSLALLAEWRPPAGSAISMACAERGHVLLATGGRQLHLLRVEGGQWAEVATTTLEHEVACVALLGGDAPGDELAGEAMETDEARPLPPMAAAGLWTDLSVRLLALPSLSEVHSEPLGGEVIPRSLLFAPFEGRLHLLAALGDGHLLSYLLTPAAAAGEPPLLSERKVVSLGTQPVSLSTFASKASPHVFACSDRPTVVHSNNGKLLYSNVNLKEAAHMTPFHSSAFPDCLAIATEDSLLIGTIDEIQKLHIRTVPLGEHARRLAHLENAKAFAVLTTQIEHGPDGEEGETNFVRLLDDQTFERSHSFELQPQETACSVLPIAFDGEPSTAAFVVVGTAFARPEEQEPSAGRILVFEVLGRTLELRAEQAVKGAVYTLEGFHGKLLAGVNNKLQLYEWCVAAAGAVPRLKLRHEHCGHIVVLYVASRGDFILVGDLMKSLALLQWSASTGAIVELARDLDAKWMTAVSFIGARGGGRGG